MRRPFEPLILGLSSDLCDLVLGRLEASNPVQAPSSDLTQPFGSFRDLLGGLRDLLRSCLQARDLQTEGGEGSEDQLNRAARIEAEVQRRLDLTNADIAPPVLAGIVSRPRELRSRLLGFLAVQALHPVHEVNPEYTSLRLLGEGLYPESWPRETLNLRNAVLELVQEGLEDSGRPYQTSEIFSGELPLDSTLRLSSSVLEKAAETLHKDGLGDADLSALRRRLEWM